MQRLKTTGYVLALGIPAFVGLVQLAIWGWDWVQPPHRLEADVACSEFSVPPALLEPMRKLREDLAKPDAFATRLALPLDYMKDMPTFKPAAEKIFRDSFILGLSSALTPELDKSLSLGAPTELRYVNITVFNAGRMRLTNVVLNVHEPEVSVIVNRTGHPGSPPLTGTVDLGALQPQERFSVQVWTNKSFPSLAACSQTVTLTHDSGVADVSYRSLEPPAEGRGYLRWLLYALAAVVASVGANGFADLLKRRTTSKV